MGLTNSEYEAVMREYDNIRYKTAELRQRHTDEVFNKVPEIKKLEDEIITDFTNLAKDALFLTHNDYLVAKENIDKKITRFNVKKQELLVQNGFPKDYLNHIYNCPVCKDTGFIDGAKCECFKAIVSKLAYSQSGIYMMADEDANFSRFVETYYPDDDFDKNTKLSSRGNALNALANLKNMADDFDNNAHSFVIYGGVGVGKTFLASCLTNSLIKNGYSVVFLTAFKFVKIFEDNTFHYNDTEDGKIIPSTDPIFTCDLLVIDDIGTEVANAFTISRLFDCINERILYNRPTILSSNWNPAQIKANYGDRIFSRLAKHYKFLKLTGEDIRTF
ncbi:MAG: ATP-binding protein [Catonella sp.]|uniref:ATP-binding protein n=1 Tax=Catonella sp. TaxID=2382125 RepID=UPI003F9F8E3D